MTDNCPQCVRENVIPITERRNGDQVSSLYRCPACGHVWSTNRDVRCYGQEAA